MLTDSETARACLGNGQVGEPFLPDLLGQPCADPN